MLIVSIIVFMKKNLHFVVVNCYERWKAVFFIYQNFTKRHQNIKRNKTECVYLSCTYYIHFDLSPFSGKFIDWHGMRSFSMFKLWTLLKMYFNKWCVILCQWIIKKNSCDDISKNTKYIIIFSLFLSFEERI